MPELENIKKIDANTIKITKPRPDRITRLIKSEVEKDIAAYEELLLKSKIRLEAFDWSV